jgi:hypothetical protein
MAKEGPIIPEGASPEEKKALRHSGGHGEGHEGIPGQSKGEANFPRHKPWKTEKYSGHGKGVGDRLESRKSKR